MPKPRNTKEYFKKILSLRYDELHTENQLDLMESAVEVLLTLDTWKDRCDAIKLHWSQVQCAQETERRKHR